MTNNMYRVGDYVYFETSQTSPYQIRRIEELNKTPSGNVEAKVMCFYRRRDVSTSLLPYADKNQSALEEEDPDDIENCNLYPNTTTTPAGEVLNYEDRHRLRHRELFLSRQIETLPATHIRGKCTVTLLNETEALLSYLKKEDTFFYSLVYDPQQKTLIADKGEIRVGSRYQSDITTLLKPGEEDGRKSSDLEELVWTPDHGLSDRQIDQFLVVSRSVGTFARALDCSSSVKQPSLHMSAAAASRDITLFHAMDTLHKHGYDISKSLCSLVPSSGPVLCRDEMEEWSASEANLFEEALEKYGKDFNDIRQDFLPWKTLKNVIEYYYMWKTTDRYVQQKRVKAVEAESKLKQVYIPNYNKTNSISGLTNGKSITTTTVGAVPGAMVNGTSPDAAAAALTNPCESCQESNSTQWYSWGPSQLQYRLCSLCWAYWKKFGGLKMPSRVARDEEKLSSGSSTVVGASGGRVHRCSIGGCAREYKTRSQLMRHSLQVHGVTLRPGSPKPIMKTRNAFFLHTSRATRVMRRLCLDLVAPRKIARNPAFPVNPMQVRTESQNKLGGKTYDDFAYLVKSGNYKRSGKVSEVSIKLRQLDRRCPGWMLPTEPNRIPKQTHIAYPKPPKGPDGSLIYTPVPNKEVPAVVVPPSTILKRKAYEDTNGVEAVDLPYKKKSKESADALDPYHLSQLGVNPPPGLTVTPIGMGVNGTPMDSPAPFVTPLAQLVAGSQSPAPATPVTTPPVSNLMHSGVGRAKIATVSRIGGRPRIISWMDAPDDVYFYSSDATRKLRGTLTIVELKRAARRPFRVVSSKAETAVE